MEAFGDRPDQEGSHSCAPRGLVAVKPPAVVVAREGQELLRYQLQLHQLTRGEIYSRG